MAAKKPLVIKNGLVGEVAAGDSLDPSSLAVASPTGTQFLADDGTFKTPSGGGGTPSGSVVVTVNGAVYTVTTYA